MKKLLTAALAAATLLPVAAPTAAEAQSWRSERWSDSRYYGRDGRYREPKRLGRNDHVWKGRDGRYYCKRDNGTTGLIVGGALGALFGRALDGGRDRTLGTVLGAGGGALLGREIDRGGVKCR